jgi:hypothetical protein
MRNHEDPLVLVLLPYTAIEVLVWETALSQHSWLTLFVTVTPQGPEGWGDDCIPLPHLLFSQLSFGSTI